MEPERKRRRPRCARDEAVAVKIARWSDQCSPLPEDARKCTRRQAKGSRKGCMKGKGGPENANCRSRGVRQRKWGKWVAEIRLPSGRGRMWLGTFATEAEAATAYDNAAAAMYGHSARLNAPQHEGSGNPATSPTLPGDNGALTPCPTLPSEDNGDPTFSPTVTEEHGDPLTSLGDPALCFTLPEENGDPEFCFTLPEENVDPAFCFTLPEENGDPTACLTPSEEHGDSASCLTQPEGHGDPAYLSVCEGYGDPTADLTLPDLHSGLAYYSTGDNAHIDPPDQFHGCQAYLGLPEFYGDPAHLDACPTYLSGPGVCDDPYFNLPELHDDPTYYPAYANLPEMEYSQVDQINKTKSDQHSLMETPADAEKPNNLQSEDWLEDLLSEMQKEDGIGSKNLQSEDWIGDLSSDFCIEDYLPEMNDDGISLF